VARDPSEPEHERAVSSTPAATLRGVRRGDEPHELQLLDSDGRIVILFGYGITPDEKIRMCEAALRLIRDVLPADPGPAGPR
jgi:hypothetical protein